jgi:hypothetical protein
VLTDRWCRAHRIGLRLQPGWRLLRGDAAFALPDLGSQYAIRLPADQVLQAQSAPLLTRPVGRILDRPARLRPARPGPMLTLDGGNGSQPGVEVRPACLLAGCRRQVGRRSETARNPGGGRQGGAPPARWARKRLPARSEARYSGSMTGMGAPPCGARWRAYDDGSRGWACRQRFGATRPALRVEREHRHRDR